MIKNGKFFVPPQHSSDNFKVLFARLAAQGVGWPVDKHDVADGPWIPDLQDVTIDDPSTSS